MGTQIRFYTLHEDESLLISYILSDNTLHLIHEDCEFGHPNIINATEKGFSELMGLTKALIWVKSCPIPDYAYWEIRNDDDNSYLTRNKRYYITALSTPCIEYSRSFINDKGVLTQGRIWVDYSYWYNDTLLNKCSELKLAYKHISTWIRHNYLIKQEVDGYIGPSALKWFQSGKPTYPPATCIPR